MLMLNGRMAEARERLEEAIPLAERLGAQALLAGVAERVGDRVRKSGRVRASDCRRSRGHPPGRGVRFARADRARVHQRQPGDRRRRRTRGGAGAWPGRDPGCRPARPEPRPRRPAARGKPRGGFSESAGLRTRSASLQTVLENATSQFILAGVRGFAGRLAAERGDLDRAEQLLESGMGVDAAARGGSQLIGPAMAARVLLELRRGELERARERAREASSACSGPKAS